MTFIQKLNIAWQQSNSLLMVGLDPDIHKMPASFKDQKDGIFQFCKGIVDATASFACGFKPQIAYFAATRAEGQLEDLCSYIRDRHPTLPLVLDAKRGDIAATAEQYAKEPHRHHAVEHPADELRHADVPHPNRRTTRWRSPPKKSPTRSITALTGSFRSVKHVPM